MIYTRFLLAGLALVGFALSPSVNAQQSEAQRSDASPQPPKKIILNDLGLAEQAGEMDTDMPVSTSRQTRDRWKVKPSKNKVVSSKPTIVKKTNRKSAHIQNSQSEMAPFYLSAAQYLALRGGQPQPQTVLDYDVQSGPALRKNSDDKDTLGSVQKIRLIFGKDYAALEKDNDVKIYDFRFNRILKITPNYGQDGKPTTRKYFNNSSLYAKVYRDITAVRRATKNGELKTMNIGSGLSLDVFWLESAMSWAPNHTDMTMKVEGLENALQVKRKGKLVFSTDLSEQPYSANIGKDSFFAFAYHEWPLHPNVLRALYGYDAPPKRFEMVSYGPTAPKGQRQVWTLVNRTDSVGRFPLPKQAIGTAQREQASPLAFLVNEAVNNRARGGIESMDALAMQVKEKSKSGDYENAWLVGQKYIAYAGGCGSARATKICGLVADIAQTKKAEMSARIQDYMTAVDLAQRPGLKAEAINAVKPYLDDVDTPAFILRLAAMERAKMKSEQARVTGHIALNSKKLLTAALAKDPYDPNTYVGLAQVLAAKGGLEQSWDINDALRAGIPTAKNMTLKIDRLEKKLKKSAPAHFYAIKLTK